MSKNDTKFGSDLMQALKEVQEYQRGEIYLPTRKMEVALAKSSISTTPSVPKIEEKNSN
jgi:hypothetical protein